jgi:hypothetical protein|tara:strand:- start:736 stop:1350 length:615 start_codon:yes stop_codon:yes gene_type:complete
VAETLVKPFNMAIANRLMGPLAQTNHFLVTLSSLTPEVETYIQNYSDASDFRRFLAERGGILCSDASLPTTSYATAEVKDNFMGIPQQYAHTRVYTDIDFTFYVDENYTLLKIFEGWMEYISSGSNRLMEQQTKSYYRRMRYPDSYKCNTLYINKFEKNFKRSIRYQFVNAFPKSMSSVPVSYGPADILKVTVSFNYDRYIVRG